MGADGHIMIWRDDVVREAFQNCDELFACLPTHYTNELDGVKYHHCYWGDNLWVEYWDEGDWYVPPYVESNATPEAIEAKRVKKEMLKGFVAWLEKNGTHWEVWT